MSNGSARKNRATSRADRPHPFDFNSQPLPAAERAAAAVSQQELRTLFDRLDRADEAFGSDGASQRAAGLDALKAVIAFLAASPLNTTGQFSRPLELLYTELQRRPLSKGGRILPDKGGGAGGVDSRPSDNYVKAAAAYTVDFLHEQAGWTVQAAAGEVANILGRRGFHFGERRTDKAAAVHAWRRDFARLKGRAAPLYQAHRTMPPVMIIGDSDADGAAIRGWLLGLLGRAGYGAVA